MSTHQTISSGNCIRDEKGQYILKENYLKVLSNPKRISVSGYSSSPPVGTSDEHLRLILRIGETEIWNSPWSIPIQHTSYYLSNTTWCGSETLVIRFEGSDGKLVTMGGWRFDLDIYYNDSKGKSREHTTDSSILGRWDVLIAFSPIILLILGFSLLGK